MNEVARPMPRPPAHVAPYVAALGAETAVSFLLHFGGPKLYIGTNPRDSNLVAKLFGQNAAVALAQSPALTNSKVKVPVANRWLAQMLYWQGNSPAEIARRLPATDSTVRRWLKEAR